MASISSCATFSESFFFFAVLSSVVHHDLPDNKGVNYGLITGDNLWKF